MQAESPKKNIALVLIYAHPENYPPTLNAITALSELYTEIIVLYRGISALNWDYPSNVILYQDKLNYSSFEQMKLGFAKKVYLFADFWFRLFWLYVKYLPDLVVAYDPIALYAFSLVRRVKKTKAKIWYHNHDVWRIEDARKYSISWWAIQSEKKSFSWLDVFSLPSVERSAYFPMDQLKGKFIFLPNLPSWHFYSRFKKVKTSPHKQLNLIYQGSLSNNHGFETLIPLLKKMGIALGIKVNLTLVGPIDPVYKNELINLAALSGATECFQVKEPLLYKVLPLETITHDVGLAIHTNSQDLNYSTAGTASNKIYEYIALGLPVIYYDNVHYRAHLASYKWAFSTDLSETSLLSCLHDILNSYEQLSSTAYQDFQTKLNFEHSFNEKISLTIN